MKKHTDDDMTDFGQFVSTKAFNHYVEEGNDVEFEEPDIVDMFIQFTKEQQKKVLKDEHYVREWIEEWVDLFPRGVKSGGKLLRSPAKDCFPKMVLFIKKYGYDRDMIFYATREYLKEQSYKDFAYTRCAIYFIGKKDEGSDLAAWCEKCKDADLTQEHNTLDIHQSNQFI